MREAAVARAGFGFGKGDVEVDVDAVVARAGAQEADDLVRHGIAAAPVDQTVGGRERAGVDQRIARDALLDRKSVVSGKSVSVRVDLGGRRILKKKDSPTVRLTLILSSKY